MKQTYECGIEVQIPQEDLWDLVGLGRDVTVNEVHQAARDLDLTQLSWQARYAWKALADRHYHRLYERTGSTLALFQAGFFDDGLPRLASSYGVAQPGWASTSLEKMRTNMERAGRTAWGRMAILVSTGGMAPIHQGHILMMEEARRQLESRGLVVVGGFLAPGHDSYVSQKYGGSAAMDAVHRCAMVELALRDSDWLELDGRAARYMPGEVNFTEVVDGLAHYASQYLPDWVDVHYVCGSDNKGFLDAIPGRVVVVERTELSSKMAREGRHDHLDPRVRDYLLSMNSSTGDLPYLIRSEEDAAIESWAGLMPGGAQELTRRRIQLESSIRLGIAQLFQRAGQDHRVQVIPLSHQVQRAREALVGRQTISLDPFFPSQHYLHSTRYFALSGSQFQPLFRAERSGHAALSRQAEGIPGGRYVLVEDDSVTGGTIMSAMSLLRRDVEVDEVLLLSEFADLPNQASWDVVDMRDFIVGSQYGGLSVNLPHGRRGRAPYALPYVSLRARAKIPAEAEMEMSRIIWRANERFFQDSGITVANADVGLVALANHLGWGTRASMEEFCRWHVERLMESV